MPKYLCDAVDHAITVCKSLCFSLCPQNLDEDIEFYTDALKLIDKSLGVYLREYANAIPSDPKVAATPGHTAPVSSTIRT